MAHFDRLVVDTNVVVSAMLFPNSVPGQALNRAKGSVVLASEATRRELVEVMSRSRFDRYVEQKLRRRLVSEYFKATVTVDIPFSIRACRDPKDDKFLEVAVHGHADILLTGDADLLELHPFRGIAILTPGAYLEMA
jgi:putative PIN family toxin of toxin-antitoxin system